MSTIDQYQHPMRTGCRDWGTNQMNELAEQFKALADATRLHIISLLMRQGEMCVCELMPALGLSQSIVSFHLKTLKYAGFVTARKEGKWMFYALNFDVFQQFYAEIGTIFDPDRWPERLEATACQDAACRHPKCR